MAVFVMYSDSACTQTFATGATIPITYDSIDAPPSSIVVDGKTYLYFTGRGQRIRGVSVLSGSAPILQSSKNRAPTTTTKYFKNGVRVRVMESNNYSGENRIEFQSLYLNGNEIADGRAETSNKNLSMYCIEFVYAGKTFIGFHDPVSAPDPYTIEPIFCAELAFWEPALRKNYEYGSGTDSNGGQGDGAIPHTNIPLSSTPRRVVPFGGHGLHAYRINNQAYNSIQGYLWGESSTIAKALWQKFQNKTHNPTSCIVGCYSLPAEFMPSGSAASGVQLAGMLLTPISGTCQDVSQVLNFVDKTYEFGKIDPPFGSWLDYSGVQIIIRIPFCGVIQAAAEYCIGKNITIRYRVDQLNGNLVCIIYADGCVIAETSGNCAYNVPVSGGDDGTLQRLGAAVTGILQITAGNYAGALSSAAEAAGAVHQTQLVNSDMHGSMTACENRVPYIEWIYPTTAYTPDYPNANGLPCEFSGTLGSFSGGYGEFEVMPASLNIPEATAAEKEEIASLLRGGVIV